jgi:hypothetical protein
MRTDASCTSNPFFYLMGKLPLIIFRSYIANLDPAYIFALFHTASFRQVSVLRYAFWKHIAFQTSIRVNIPVSA